VALIGKSAESLDWEKDARMSRGSTVSISRQLSVMLNAGVHLRDALEVLARGQHLEGPRLILSSMMYRVEEGASLSEALDKFPRAFNGVYRALIQTGERTGRLGQTLNQLADWLEAEEHLLRKVRGALFYPFIVLIVASFLTVGFFLWILPGFAATFSDFDQLPLVTRALFALAPLVRSPLAWAAGLALFFLSLRSVRAVLVSSRNRAGFWRISSGTIVGELFRDVSSERFSTTMAILLESGVDFLSSYELAVRASGSPVLESDIDEAICHFRTGGSLAEYTRSKPGVFAPVVSGMVLAGEEAAKLPRVFRRLSILLRDETDTRLVKLSALLEPVLLALVGMLVGGLVMAILSPMYLLLDKI
jgi:type II secretory pathway component PulF